MTGGNNSTVIKSFETVFQPTGGGRGVSLYIETETAEMFELEKADVSVEFIENEQGQPEIVITDLPTGFGEKEFVELAEENGWKHIISNQDVIRGKGESEYWGHTYDTSDGVRIEIDGKAHIGGKPCNNINITGPKTRVTTEEEYRTALDVTENDLYFGVTDSEGLLARLDASVDHDIEWPPEPETVRAVLGKLDAVFVGVESHMCSLTSSIDSIEETVEDVAEVSKNIEESVSVEQLESGMQY